MVEKPTLRRGELFIAETVGLALRERRLKDKATAEQLANLYAGKLMRRLDDEDIPHDLEPGNARHVVEREAERIIGG